MAAPNHTFGQTCHLSRNIPHNGAKEDDDIPYLKAQYFYYATYSVDDPLSAVPIPTGAESNPTQHPPLPFSARDNNALEEAWLGVLMKREKKKSGSEDHKGGQGSNPLASDGSDGLVAAISKQDQGSQVEDGSSRQRPTTQTRGRTGRTVLETPNRTLNTSSKPSVELLKSTTRSRQGSIRTPNGSVEDGFLRSNPLQIKTSATGGSNSASPINSLPSSAPHIGSAGTSGLPFVKLPERSASPRPNSSRTRDFEMRDSRQASPSRKTQSETVDGEAVVESTDKLQTDPNDHSDVPVGISRLYLVELPSLLMKPIYWAHVHDTAPVIRATWFYKNSMLPVEPSVANQLEMGYRELRPWSRTWKDELTSAAEVGAAGEEKIAHQLWPKEGKPELKNHLLSADPETAAKRFQPEAAIEGSLEEDAAPSETKVIKKRFSNYQVIYKDGQVAFLLKPTLQPSAYYGRKPLQKIRRGRGVGIEVVRGFNRQAWEKLHPSKKVVVSSNVAAKVPVSGIAESASADFCPACKAQEETPNVTDLCLVIHGIGQKLSERVESFNFTHACNSVRRSVNVELANDSVKKALRKDLGGIMVLPVNWRSNLSFEDGGPRRDGDKDEIISDFTLKEITPHTIPAVRNLISDVMLDIPFYMSHHKDKMIQAVVREANRVYQLWCKNNPGFHNNGRVHIIAHSLGSTMAFEILSKQPTIVDEPDLVADEVNTKHFDFNTTNLFCAGSPAGFFLLLERSKLIPRRGRNKPGAEPGDDQDDAIVGETGTFGCLAVDNIYNIMHCNDPIAYRLNATVDPQYASSLREAHVPSATTGFFEGIGNAVRSVTPGLAPPVDLAVGQVAKPPLIPRLPSQLEMEVHDFTREEIAEKKFLLLNDNCQIDWLLSSGGGPFDIAYLDMLGAHSSYWEKKEFIRLLVTEVGRKPGKGTTLPNMRAQKVAFKG